MNMKCGAPVEITGGLPYSAKERDRRTLPASLEISELVRKAARRAGFDLAGIAPAADSAELEYFPNWIASGHAGEMKYLEARDQHGNLKRASLRHTAPWARSVIVCALNYNTAAPYSTQLSDASRGWISRYAWGRGDYHDSLLLRLREVEAALKNAGSGDVTTRCYVDTGPLVERVYARYAGIGWIGKNTCVINQKNGSWLFLGVILASLELTADLPAPDRCGTCTRCLDACPTHAFIGPRQLDASKCISYLTIEKRGTIPEDLRVGMGRHVFGCDICQDVCPWNRKAPATLAEEFEPRPEMVNPALDWLAELSAEEFRARFRATPVSRAKRTGLRRNALIAIGNSGDAKFLPLLEKLEGDDDAVVAETARWSRSRISVEKPRQKG